MKKHNLLLQKHAVGQAERGPEKPSEGFGMLSRVAVVAYWASVVAAIALWDAADRPDDRRQGIGCSMPSTWSTKPI
jgi:hypothetical protein